MGKQKELDVLDILPQEAISDKYGVTAFDEEDEE